MVASAVQNADEFFGCVPPLFLLLIFTFVMGIGIFSSTSLAKNLLAALSFVAFPVTTLVYGLLRWAAHVLVVIWLSGRPVA